MGKAFAGAIFAGFALALAGCRGCGKSPVDAPPVDAATSPVAADASVDAAVKPELLPPDGRIFFGKAKRQNDGIAVKEIFVGRDGAAIRLILEAEELTATASPADAGASEMTLTSKSASGAVEIVLHEDGSFDGALTYSDGSKTEWERSPYQPLAATQLDPAVPLEGFLAKTLRYRMKLAAKGERVDGVARYPVTREDLKVRGTVDASSRRVALEEVAHDGTVTGLVDALVLGHLRPKPFDSDFVLIGTWSSPDRTRKLPLRLQKGFYPERVALPGGVFLSAQEKYSDDCGLIDEAIWPVLDNAPKDLTKRVNDALGVLAADNVGSATEPRPDPKTLIPGNNVREKCPANEDPEHHGRSSSHYTATKLHDSVVAMDIEHYVQSGSTHGLVWSDCIIADLATGDVVDPEKLLDAPTRATLEAHARTAALASLADAGETDNDERAAARGLVISETSPLCIGEKQVRFGVGGHPVFGPPDPLFDRAEFVGLLPAGKLRELVAP